MAYGRLRAQRCFGGIGKENKMERRMQAKRNKELFIESIGKIAQEDWHRRHICVPSIVIAIALEARTKLKWIQVNYLPIRRIFM